MCAKCLGSVSEYMALKIFQRSALAAFCLFFGACASSPKGAVWPYPEPPESGDWGYHDNAEPTPETDDGNGDYQPLYPGPDDPGSRSQQQPAVSSHPTVMQLVQQAEQQRADGELDQAAATLERAIRLVNNDALPWLKLAEVRYEQSNFIQAETLAKRSISFAGSGPIAREAWLLIADIKRLQGNESAARDAENQARQQ